MRAFKAALLTGSILSAWGIEGQALAQSPNVSEVVVTAQRREQNLQEVPIAVAAMSGAQAEASGMHSMDDIKMASPSLNWTRSLGAATPYIRGVGTVNSTPGDESSVSTYVDGVYFPSMPGSVFALANIERIEVLRGPQGTLFGRNATGGVINIVTKAPSFTPAARATVSYGNYKTFAGAFYGTTPLSDKLAADLSVYVRDQGEGFGRNIATGNEIDLSKEKAIRGSLLFTPGDDTELKLTVDYNRLKSSFGTARRPVPGSILAGGYTYLGWFTHNENRDPVSTTEQAGASAKLTHDFGPVSFVSISAYRAVKSNDLHDQDGSPIPLLNLDINKKNRTFTQEFQLLSDTNHKLTWIVGAYYLHDNSKFDPLLVSGTGVAPLVFSEIRARQLTNSIAGFGQVTYALLDDTNLTLGARYTRDTRSMINLASTNLGPRAIFTGKEHWGQWTWRASLDHKFSDDLMGYVSYNRGFKSGLWNLSNGASPAIDPETLDAYEAGLKSDLADGRLRLNAAVFHYKERGIQLSAVVQGGTRLYNAAAGRVNGLEFEAIASPVQGLTFHAGLTLLDAKYTNFPTASISTPRPGGGVITVAGDAAGKRMIRSPKATANASVDYTTDMSFGQVAYNVTYYRSSKFYWEPDNRLRQPAYDLVNAQIAWTAPSGRYGLKFWGRNIFDEKYDLLQNSGNGDQAAPAEPRTYGVTAEVRF